MPLEYVERFKQLILPSTIDPHESRKIKKGDGVWIWDDFGKKYFDASSQVSLANIGHSHPRLIRWMVNFLQAGLRGEAVLEVIATDGYYENILEVDGQKMDLTPAGLAERLSPHLFGSNTKFFYDVSGAQGVNDAIRIFSTITKKQKWFSFDKAFHGRHGESRDSSSSNPIHWNEAPRNKNVTFLPFPETEDDLILAIKRLSEVNLKKYACLIYEPIQGEGGGMRVGHYLKELEQTLKNEGVYSISDEIQAGLGRCGQWFGYQKLDLNPDAVVLSKSLGTIVPVSAIGVRADINGIDVFPNGKIAGTFPMYPVGMAAANFVLRIYEEEKIVEHVKNLSPKLGGLLIESIQPYDIHNLHGMKLPFMKIDGLGFYRSIKFYKEDGTPNTKWRDWVSCKLRELGVWTYPASKSYPAIRITPPLVSTEQDLKLLSYLISQAIRA